MRKYLGVFVVVAAQCVMSWAQAPTPAQTPAPAPAQTPAPAPATAPPPEPTTIPTSTTPAAAPAPEFPRVELFAGGSYAESGFFNAGHWAGLPGWDASLGANLTPWLGFLVEGGQYFGTSQIPTAAPAPFPNCPPFCPNSSPTFNATTREYNILFGVHFARRKYVRWTPFAEVLYGHQGVRGQVIAEAQTFNEVGTGRAFTAGVGIDRQINRRFALRFKADYFETGTAFPGQPKQTQDNFRVSGGIVIRNVKKKKRTLEDETEP